MVVGKSVAKAKPENAQTLALRALRAISKSSPSALQLDSVPHELLCGDEIDLKRW